MNEVNWRNAIARSRDKHRAAAIVRANSTTARVANRRHQRTKTNCQAYKLRPTQLAIVGGRKATANGASPDQADVPFGRAVRFCVASVAAVAVAGAVRVEQCSWREMRSAGHAGCSDATSATPTRLLAPHNANTTRQQCQQPPAAAAARVDDEDTKSCPARLCTVRHFCSCRSRATDKPQQLWQQQPQSQTCNWS